MRDSMPQILRNDDEGTPWQTAFLTLVGLLSSTVLLKIVVVQYLEIIYLLQILILLLIFTSNDYQVVWYRPFLRLATFWTTFLVAAILLGLASARFQFYLPDTISLLRRPIAVTFSRALEIGASVAILLYLAHEFRRSVRKRRFTMRLYFWAGVVSAVYSLLSYPLDVAGIISLGAYGDAHRLRGFYNEGGPYGLYVLSLFFVGVALEKQGLESKLKIRSSFLLLAAVFVMAFSKAAICAGVALFFLNALFGLSLRKRLLMFGAGLLTLLAVAQTPFVGDAIKTFQKAGASYERVSHFKADDGNYVYGRVAGFFIVPRMIAEHPLTGVGLGNYGVLRNAPEYRGTAVWVDEADDPGLGMAGYAAELGLPLFAFTYLCLFLPAIYLQRLHAPSYLINLALVQPVVHSFGAQLNLTYPWIVTMFALGLGFSEAKSSNTESPALLAMDAQSSGSV